MGPTDTDTEIEAIRYHLEGGGNGVQSTQAEPDVRYRVYPSDFTPAFNQRLQDSITERLSEDIAMQIQDLNLTDEQANLAADLLEDMRSLPAEIDLEDFAWSFRIVDDSGESE